MTPKYVRPTIEEREFVDDRGRTILYGRRRDDAPHADLRDRGTNVFSHQERYAPIFTVADALVAHLVASYDVVVEEDLRLASRFATSRRAPEPAFVRVVEVRPVDSTEAPIVLGFRDRPGSLDLLAGWYSDFDMWFCGCDACDEPWDDVADSLEDVILSIAEHGMTEKVDRRAWGRARYALDPTEQDTWTGSIPKRMLRPEILEASHNTSRDLDQGRWRPWTRRSTTD